MEGSDLTSLGDTNLDRALGEAVRQAARLADALHDAALRAQVTHAGREIIAALASGHKILVLGNGGSAAMAAHIAAEFSGKCVRDRRPLPAISLADSPAAITAIGNDYGFEHVFTRGLRALGRPGDVVIAMSTSGTSRNVVDALRIAHECDLRTILLTGAAAPDDQVAHHVLRAPTDYTPRIQEVHLLWAHSWCEAVDATWATQD